jgi:hypothetical protein
LALSFSLRRLPHIAAENRHQNLTRDEPSHRGYQEAQEEAERVRFRKVIKPDHVFPQRPRAESVVAKAEITFRNLTLSDILGQRASGFLS